MTKTIEEAAKSIAEDFIIEHKGRINNDAPLTHECVQYAVERIMSLPLASRLTEAEKERVRTKYNAAKIGATEFDSPECADLMDILEDIFSTDFFKEGE